VIFPTNGRFHPTNGNLRHLYQGALPAPPVLDSRIANSPHCRIVGVISPYATYIWDKELRHSAESYQAAGSQAGALCIP